MDVGRFFPVNLELWGLQSLLPCSDDWYFLGRHAVGYLGLVCRERKWRLNQGKIFARRALRGLQEVETKEKHQQKEETIRRMKICASIAQEVGKYLFMCACLRKLEEFTCRM